MKKAFSIILLFLLFFSVVGSIQAAEATIIDYPDLEGAVTPGKALPGEELPQLIKYIFTFSLGAVGILGLLMIIYGGFIYMTSIGNPQKATEGKDRILSALLGIVLLLGSYLLLNIINPDLLKLGITLDSTKIENESFWACYYCNGENCKPDILLYSCKKGTFKKIRQDCTSDASTVVNGSKWEAQIREDRKCATINYYSCTCNGYTNDFLWCNSLKKTDALAKCENDCKRHFEENNFPFPVNLLFFSFYSVEQKSSCENK